MQNQVSTVERPLLEMRGITKTFPGVKALDAVDFTLRRGEIHALMGENGAGKSTLIKVLTGVHAQDKGEILMEGKPFRAASTMEAPALGISTVYQEVNLLPNLSVAENIFIGREPLRRGGRINWDTMYKRSEELLTSLDVIIDVTAQLDEYSTAIQQMVAIARALDIEAKLLILDEPTSSLDQAESNLLFEVMRKLRDQGLGIIFITHFLDQVYETSDQITVLRNGALVGSYETAQLPKVDLVVKMIGREIAERELKVLELSAEAQTDTEHPVILEASELGRRGNIQPFDLSVRKGEVIGLAGLLGSGRTEMARLLFGIDRPHSGTIRMDGNSVRITNPRLAIRHGMGFCPEDRKAEGIIPELTVKENIILALRARTGLFRQVPRKRLDELVNRYIKALGVKTPSAEQIAGNLSGGNQQKVIIARWLAMDPGFLILDEPTRGIDVGAKAEIQSLIRDLCEREVSVLFISSEIEEVLRVSDRIAVLRDKEKVTELVGDERSEDQIMETIAGGAQR